MHKLDSIAENVRECQKCELCETRIKAVPGKGNFDADVIFVPDTPAILASVTAALIMLALSTELSANSLEVIAFTAI